MKAGSIVIALHTHLPYVMNHGFDPHGEAWIYEAVCECYIPLLNVIEDAAKQGIAAKFTIDISPILCEQLEQEDFKDGFIKYCDDNINAANQDKKEFIANGSNRNMIDLADFWINWFKERKEEFIKRYKKSIIKAFKKLQDKNLIEITTCGATHGYFPLLGLDESIHLQVETAKLNYMKHFEKPPKGIWLPECAYRPSYDWKTYFEIEGLSYPHKRKGVEQILSEHDIKYFFTDEKFIRELQPLGKFDSYENKQFHRIGSEGFREEPWNFHADPLNIFNVASKGQEENGTAVAFARHRNLCMLVWSGEIGYPAEGDYLDFHKKHANSRLRYWSVTNTKIDMAYKRQYSPDSVWEKLDLQSNHFIHHIENTVNYYKNMTGKNSVITLSFDTELFGHWWFEGPMFLKYLIEGLNKSPWIELKTANEVIEDTQPKDVIAINEGSWGVNNSHEVWINEGNKWVWEKIYHAELRFAKIMLQVEHSKLNNTLQRIINQTMRELLLMQASDWPFLIYTEQARDYAEHRFHCHEDDYNKLCEIAERLIAEGKWQLKKAEKELLETCENRNDVFAKMSSDLWRS